MTLELDKKKRPIAILQKYYRETGLRLNPSPSLGAHEVVDSGGALVLADDVLLESVELGR